MEVCAMRNDEPGVRPAPSNVLSLAGQFYVSRGTGEFAEYLQAGGTWGHPCYYFRNEAAAQRALDEKNDILPPPLASNIDADVIYSRMTKHSLGR